MMKFDRPLVIIDFESTGVDPTESHIVQIAMLKVWPDKREESKNMLVNPGIPIPKEASDIHGITDEMVKDKPYFKQYSKGILKFLEGCNILGFNSNHYDTVLLYYEFYRCGINWDNKVVNFIDACTIYKRKEERTLSAAVKFYLGRNHEGAHDAMADVKATKEVFEKQLEVYPDLPKTEEELNLFSNYDKPRLDIGGKLGLDAQGDIIFNFGKNKGKKVKDEKDYAKWVLNGNFAPDVKEIIDSIINIKK